MKTYINRKTLALIGEFTINFNHLENIVSILIWNLMKDEQTICHIITSDLSFRKKLELLSSLFIYRFPDKKKEMKKLCNELNSINVKRNNIVHSLWLKDIGDNSKKLKFNRSKGFKFLIEDVGLKELKNILYDMEVLHDKVYAFDNKVKKLFF